MGRLEHEPSIQHFSHPHPLQLTNPQTLTVTAPCSGCELQPSGWMYTCKPCNFTLHLSCTQMPQLINHPSHSLHPLTLLPTPPYPGGVFNCDACGHLGRGFCFHCTHCDFDVHILCASKPLFLMNHLHAHKLEIMFDPPYKPKGFSCDICHKVGSNHWLYRCSLCGFDAHLDCASNVTNMPQAETQTQTQIQMQHYNSFPGNQLQNGNTRPGGVNNFAHSKGMGTLQTSQVGMSRINNNVNGNRYASPNGNFVHNQSMGTYQNSQVGMPGAANGNYFVNSVQSMMNDGSGGGNGEIMVGTGEDNSSSMMDFGFSF